MNWISSFKNAESCNLPFSAINSAHLIQPFPALFSFFPFSNPWCFFLAFLDITFMSTGSSEHPSETLLGNHFYCSHWIAPSSLMCYTIQNISTLLFDQGIAISITLITYSVKVRSTHHCCCKALNIVVISFLKSVACCCSHINSLANHSNALSEVCLRHFWASEQTGMLFWNLE